MTNVNYTNFLSTLFVNYIQITNYAHSRTLRAYSNKLAQLHNHNIMHKENYPIAF